MRNQLAAFYLSYVNDFLTAEGIANHHAISIAQARILIEMGRAIHEENVSI